MRNEIHKLLGLLLQNAVVFYMSHERETTKGLDYSWFFSSTRVSIRHGFIILLGVNFQRATNRSMSSKDWLAIHQNNVPKMEELENIIAIISSST